MRLIRFAARRRETPSYLTEEIIEEIASKCYNFFNPLYCWGKMFPVDAQTVEGEEEIRLIPQMRTSSITSIPVEIFNITKGKDRTLLLLKS
jgi:hypothetical protein